jgi:nucleotide-binding universal stress UspA family protein
MFQRIVVPLDGSARAERAIPVAVRLARASGGSLVLLRIADIPVEYEPALYASYVSQTPFYEQEIQEAELAKARAYLADAAQSAQLAGIKVETQALPGEPAPAILACAGKEGDQRADLVVMCRHGRTGLRRWALGSVAHKVARQSPVPVLIVPPALPGYEDGLVEAAHPLRVLVAVDGSPLAGAAIAPAAQLVGALATPNQGGLHLARVVQLPAVASENHAWQSVLKARERIMQEAAASLSALVDTTRAGVAAPPGLRVTWSIAVNEDVAEAIIRMAELGEDSGVYEDEGCDLVAMATHGRGGFERWRLGSITERVLTGTKLPVLVVRPHEHDMTSSTLPVQDEGIAGS